MLIAAACVGVDPRVELMMIVLGLAGDNGYAPPRLQPYLSHVDSHFGPYCDHAAVVLPRQRGGSLRSEDGVPLAPFHIRFSTRAATGAP